MFSGTFSNYTSLFLEKQCVNIKDSNHNSAPMSTTHPAFSKLHHIPIFSNISLKINIQPSNKNKSPTSPNHTTQNPKKNNNEFPNVVNCQVAAQPFLVPSHVLRYEWTVVANRRLRCRRDGRWCQDAWVRWELHGWWS